MNSYHFFIAIIINLVWIPSAFSSQFWIGLQCEYQPTEQTASNNNETKVYKIKYYIHEANRIVKNENLNDLVASFDNSGIQINMSNQELGNFKVLISPGYQESTLFVQTNGAQPSHFKATCQSARIDTCELYPSTCYPNSDRGF